jgi:hypothetical protein
MSLALTAIAGRAVTCFTAGNAAAHIAPSANLVAIAQLRSAEGFADRIHTFAPMPPLRADAYTDLGVTAAIPREKHDAHFVAIDRALLGSMKAILVDEQPQAMIRAAAGQYERQYVRACHEQGTPDEYVERYGIAPSDFAYRLQLEPETVIPTDIFMRWERGSCNLMGGFRLVKSDGRVHFTAVLTLPLPDVLPLPEEINVLGLRRSMYDSIASHYPPLARTAAAIGLRLGHHPLATSEARAAERAFLAAFGVPRRKA